nr:MAG TPA: hypothetical protein [Caudoviricetes sp.]
MNHSGYVDTDATLCDNSLTNEDTLCQSTSKRCSKPNR